MAYGYLGQNAPNQTVSNSGVFDISDIADLEKQGKFGGSLELIEEQSSTGLGSPWYIDFTSIQESKYDVHYFTYICDTTNAQTMYLRFRESGTWETASVYKYANQYGGVTGSFGEEKSTGASEIKINGSQSNALVQGYCYLYNLGNSSKYSFVTHQGMRENMMRFGGGLLPQASTVDGIRFGKLGTSDFDSISAKLFGVKQL